MGNYSKINSQSGLSIIATVMIMLMLALFAAVGVSLVTTGSGIGLQEEQGNAALYIAEGGLEKAAFKFKTTTCASVLTGENDIPLGEGTFTINSSTRYNPTSKTLSAEITAAVTTIPVNSSAGFAPKGRITIESEKIDYYGTSISPDNLLYAVRGVAGTTAAIHVINTPVAQDQCSIQSTGKITTNPLAPTIQRVVERYLQPAAAADDCTTCHDAIVNAPLCGGGCAGGTRRATVPELSQHGVISAPLQVVFQQIQ